MDDTFEALFLLSSASFRLGLPAVNPPALTVPLMVPISYAEGLHGLSTVHIPFWERAAPFKHDMSSVDGIIVWRRLHSPPSPSGFDDAPYCELPEHIIMVGAHDVQRPKPLAGDGERIIYLRGLFVLILQLGERSLRLPIPCLQLFSER